MKIGNLLWTETHNTDYGFRPGRELRVTILPRGRDEKGQIVAAFDRVFKVSSSHLKVVNPYPDGIAFTPMTDPFNDERVTANAEDTLDAD